jgi:hypothetical protein
MVFFCKEVKEFWGDPRRCAGDFIIPKVTFGFGIENSFPGFLCDRLHFSGGDEYPDHALDGQSRVVVSLRS